MKRILIIDDEEEIRKALSKGLELSDEGYEILDAGTGQSGLDKAREIRPDLILLDLMLPDISGVEICRSLKSDEEYKSIQIIMLTALDDTETIVKGLSAGADDYVSKPFNMKELLARVQSNLRMKELYDAVKNEEEEKSALLDVSKSLSTTMDPHETLYVIVSKIAEVIEVKRCSIIYVDPHTKKAFVMASHDQKRIKHLNLDLDKYPEIQMIIKTGNPVIVDDVYNDPILFSVRETLNIIDIKSIMAFPIAFKDALIGTLILRTTRREEPFNEREIRFCEVISHLAAAPLKNAYLFEILHKEKAHEQEKRVVAEEKNKSLIEILEIIRKTQSEFILGKGSKSSFGKLLKNLISLTNSEYGFIGEVVIPEKDDPYLKTVAITNIAWDKASREFYEKNAPGGIEFTNLKTLFGAVITTGRPVISNDPSNDSRSGGIPEGHPPPNAFMGLPFYSGEKMVGVVGIANRPGGYDDKQIEYLQPFLATCSTIMEAVKVEDLRNEAEAQIVKLSQAVKYSSSSIVMTDTEGKIEYVNPKFTEITGYASEEVIGQNPRALKSGKTPPETYKELWQTICSGGEWKGKFYNKKKNGELYWEAASISPVKSSEGVITHFIAVKEDITESEMEKDKLDKTHKELIEKKENLERFHKVTVGRELDMIKLKEEVNKLLEELGREKKY